MKKYGNIGTLVYQPPEQMNNKMNYGKVGIAVNDRSIDG
jgi:hypothetical protein